MSFSRDQMRAMESTHDESYINEIKKMLQIEAYEIGNIPSLHNFLNSEAGQEALRNYHQRIGTLPKLKQIDDTVYPKAAEPQPQQGGWSDLFESWRLVLAPNFHAGPRLA
jgi:hypothetical protein